MEVSYFFIFCVLIVLIICGDIELNPGPKKHKSCDNFSLCHWNINGIAALEFSKLSLLEAYNAHYMYDIICLSETCLDSSVSFDDPRLNLSGYKLVRADNLSNNKRGGIVTLSPAHLFFAIRERRKNCSGDEVRWSCYLL